ncbi:hypothetical protein AA101099_2508 [Neoasaia chiangmaiensis NBRC 101099]|uniref:Uncharacterized protein n=1 Tax=Neoasaia chiangmaiensis TaxID=320497 RepID=A0A1U9KPY6_9PROT|nr:hypothetical protein A0U93_07500 [Neoasaia chiangmaiensis]GBR41493.1 hypothetical protein AA101099_2508 [Neoasaia chiangmaiensis NBRC 101099]GEN14416.1 hypothetical protein NCH01_08470 [Neoasaia chiangmaiensis]
MKAFRRNAVERDVRRIQARRGNGPRKLGNQRPLRKKDNLSFGFSVNIACGGALDADTAICDFSKDHAS